MSEDEEEIAAAVNDALSSVPSYVSMAMGLKEYVEGMTTKQKVQMAAMANLMAQVEAVIAHATRCSGPIPVIGNVWQYAGGVNAEVLSTVWVVDVYGDGLVMAGTCAAGGESSCWTEQKWKQRENTMETVERREGHAGTWVEQERPWGWYRKAALMCPDGTVRKTTRMAASADSFYSVPCAVEVYVGRGVKKTVSGYMTVDEVVVREEGKNEEEWRDVIVYAFIPYANGRNADVFAKYLVDSAFPDGAAGKEAGRE